MHTVLLDLSHLLSSCTALLYCPPVPPAPSLHPVLYHFMPLSFFAVSCCAARASTHRGRMCFQLPQMQHLLAALAKLRENGDHGCAVQRTSQDKYRGDPQHLAWHTGHSGQRGKGGSAHGRGRALPPVCPALDLERRSQHFRSQSEAHGRQGPSTPWHSPADTPAPCCLPATAVERSPPVLSFRPKSQIA